MSQADKSHFDQFQRITGGSRYDWAVVQYRAAWRRWMGCSWGGSRRKQARLSRELLGIEANLVGLASV